jgi:predicted glutamine amidotransferase
MCRLYGFLANERTKVECTLVLAQNALLRQSRGDLAGKSHSDGWGIACYPDGQPQRERRATAAHKDIRFSTTAERTYSHAVVAHVRRATVGLVSLENTHPFVYGCWTFAHNGTLANFQHLEAQLLDEAGPQLRKERRGTTDSELIFLWLLNRFDKHGISLTAPCKESGRIANVLADSLLQLADMAATGPSDEDSRLNFILTDGHVLLATRWNHSLYYVERLGVHDCEICGIPHIEHDPGRDYRACVIASEPISHELWHPLTDHTVLVAESDVDIHFYAAA